MKVRITTPHGQFDAELDEGTTVAKLFNGSGNTVTFTVIGEGEDGQRIRVTMLKSLIRVVEEDL